MCVTYTNYEFHFIFPFLDQGVLYMIDLGFILFCIRLTFSHLLDFYGLVGSCQLDICNWEICRTARSSWSQCYIVVQHKILFFIIKSNNYFVKMHCTPNYPCVDYPFCKLSVLPQNLNFFVFSCSYSGMEKILRLKWQIAMEWDLIIF